MGNYIQKYFNKKNNNSDEDQIPLFDYSTQINEVNEKCNDTYRYLDNELIPVINELKSRLYNLEVKNNYLNRELASIKYKIEHNDDDEFCSVVDEIESKSEIGDSLESPIETPTKALIDI